MTEELIRPSRLIVALLFLAAAIPVSAQDRYVPDSE